MKKSVLQLVCTVYFFLVPFGGARSDFGARSLVSVLRFLFWRSVSFSWLVVVSSSCFSFFFVRSRAPACCRSAQPSSSCSRFGHPLMRQGAWSSLCLGSLNPATAKISFCHEKSSLSLLSAGRLLGFGIPLPFCIFGMTFDLVRLQLVCPTRRSSWRGFRASRIGSGRQSQFQPVLCSFPLSAGPPWCLACEP
jgi:hypothetical protein